MAGGLRYALLSGTALAAGSFSSHQVTAMKRFPKELYVKQEVIDGDTYLLAAAETSDHMEIGPKIKIARYRLIDVHDYVATVVKWRG